MCKIFILVFLMLMYEKSYAMVYPITLQLLYVKIMSGRVTPFTEYFG